MRVDPHDGQSALFLSLPLSLSLPPHTRAPRGKAAWGRTGKAAVRELRAELARNSAWLDPELRLPASRTVQRNISAVEAPGSRCLSQRLSRGLQTLPPSYRWGCGGSQELSHWTKVKPCGGWSRSQSGSVSHLPGPCHSAACLVVTLNSGLFLSDATLQMVLKVRAQIEAWGGQGSLCRPWTLLGCPCLHPTPAPGHRSLSVLRQPCRALRVPFVLLSVLQALRDWFLPKPSRLRERRKGVCRFPGMGAAMEPPSARPRQAYLKGGTHQRGRKAQGLGVQRPKAARGESHCESGLGGEVFRKCVNVPAVPPVPEPLAHRLPRWAKRRGAG